MTYDSTKWQTNLRLILKKLLTTGITIKGKRLEFHKGTIWEYVDEIDPDDDYTTINTYDKASRLTLNELFHYVSDISDSITDTMFLQKDEDDDPFMRFLVWVDEMFYLFLDIIRKYEPELEKRKFIQRGYTYVDEIKKEIP